MNGSGFDYLSNKASLYGGSGGGGGTVIKGVEAQIVAELPQNPTKNTFYMVGNDTDGYALYYIDKNGTIAKVSNFDIDLSHYIQDTQLDNITLFIDENTKIVSAIPIINVTELPTENINENIFYKLATTIDEETTYSIHFRLNGEWKQLGENLGDIDYETMIINKPKIDYTTLTINTTRQDIKLIGEEDLIKDSDFIAPKENGIDIVLNTGTSDNPNIINDDPAYKYANNKTSSNNYINTRLETIERKADAKTLTKFVDALPANPDINTEYYVETATPNVYDRYFVDSIGTVKEIGNTTMDVSTLATKTELNLKEDLSNKTTTLDDNSTNTQYPSAKAVVDLVNSSSAVKLYKHNIKWGNGSTNFCYFNFISTRSTPYTDKVEMAKDMIALGISATSPVNCYNSYNQQGLLYVAYYIENGTMYYKISYEASSYSASNWTYLMGDTVTPLYSIATAGSPICVDASSDVGITLSWNSSIMQASKEYYKVRFDNKTKHTFNLNIMLCGNNYSAGTQYKLTNTAITGLDLLPATDYQSSLVCATAIKHQTTAGGSTFGYVICSLSLIDKNIYFYFSNAVSFSQSNKYCLPIHFEWWK